MRNVAFLVVALVAASASADVRRGEWRIARPIVLPKLSNPQLVYLPLDDQALTTKALSEYRVVRDGHAEAPYRMVVEEGQREVRILPATTVSEGRLGKQAQVTVDLGADAPPANQVRLALGGDNFRSQVRVEGSRDRGRWWLLKADGLVYRHEARFERTAVAIPPNDYRFLRVTVSQLQGKLPTVISAQVVSELTIPRKLVAVPAKLSRREDRKQQQTVLTLDAGKLTRDLAQVKFDIVQPAFDRSLTMEAAAPKQSLGWVGEATLRREKPESDVSVPLQMLEARRLRLTITNGDDPPLTIRGVTLWRVRRGLVFSADPARAYELWYGHRNAAEPVYDIQRLPMATAPAQLPAATLGPAHRLPLKPPPPPPWSEQHRAIFWGVLAVVIILLALVILRAMRATKPASGAQ